MPIDINIMCVKQQSEVNDYEKEMFLLEKLNDYPTNDVIYSDNWFLYNSIMGIGYNLYLSESPDLTYNLVDFKEKKRAASYFKYMLQDEKKPSNSILEKDYFCVIFNDQYINKFEKLLNQVINNSKINTCIVFFRLQISCPERYVGRISLKQFISLLKKEEVYLNTAYIISEAEYD